MPYINAKISNSPSPDALEAFKADMGDAITAFPGKTERWLMVNVEDNAKMWFAGTGAPCAMVTVSVFGALNAASCGKMTALVTQSVNRRFGIPSDRVYVKYEAVGNWGFDGSNF